MRELYFFDSAFLDYLPDDDRKFFTRLHRQLPLINGRPFFLNSDGTIDAELEGFCRSLVSGSRRSPATWKTYAIQANVYLRYLDSQETDWKSATRETLQAYYTVRTTGQFQDGAPLIGKSWNVAKTAIVLLYEQAFDDGLIDSLPFKYRASKGMSGQTGIPTADIGAKTTDEPPNFISLPHYKNIWRPAALQASTGQRDIVLSDLMITTGLRISEALSIDLKDIPNPDIPVYTHRKSIRITVVGKGSKARSIPIPKRIIRAIRFYISEDRQAIMEFSKATYGDKARLSTKVFLSREGNPLSVRRVETIFKKVSDETGLKLIPHGCRHTFAIYQLEAMVKRLAINLKSLKESGRAAYEQIMNDPLRALQKLLGHARITSTYIYLDFLEETEALVDESLADWSNWEKEHEQ